MEKIYAKLFGSPQILKNGEKIFFPYAKINALIYYILINKIVSRDEMAGLLWPDENEKIAKKNLRNALYQAKKCIGLDFIVSPKKSILILNNELNIESDVDIFLKDPKNNLDLYKGDFLQGFFLKDAEDYEYWIIKNRSTLQDKFTSESYLNIEKDIDSENYENIEQRINDLIQLDEFDEKNFRLLMKFYQKTGRNVKVIETYHDLSKLLNNELGVTPDAETKKIYDKSIDQIDLDNTKKKLSEDFYYGRYQEIASIEKTLKTYKEEGIAKSIFVTGEAGIGKSSLKEKVFKNKKDDFIIIESFCYQAEKDYSLRSFSVLADKASKILKNLNIELSVFLNSTISDVLPHINQNLLEPKILESKDLINCEMISQTLVDILRKINEEKKLVIIFEDMQWMDKISIKLLTSVMLHLRNEVVFFLTARAQHNQDLENLLTSLQRYNQIEKIELERFDFQNSKNFLEKALPDTEFEEEKIKKIYSESEGNPFFLSEYINLLKSDSDIDIMSSKMVDTIKSRFLYLSEDEINILNLVSFFYDEADLDILAEVINLDEYDVIKLLEELENRNILKEINHTNRISIIFTHSKLREYIYMIQPDSKKKIMHKKIGEILESRLKRNKKTPYIYSKLVYHFDKSGEQLKTLKYKIEMLNYYLNFSHELFPILTIQESEKENIYISRDKINEMFENIMESFKDLRANESPEDINLLEIEFFYMKGRYLIRDGNYKDGLNDIRYVIGKATETNNQDYILDGYKQFIFYNIQTNNPKEMIEYIELALDLAVKCNYHKEIGILLRLKGLYNMMIGNYYTAEQLLNESINTLTVTKEVANKYSINIAAAYNYIGELRNASGKYEEAIEMFKSAIKLSEDKNALSSLSIFYINMGKSYFSLNDLENSKKYFNSAYNLYGQFDSFWKRAVLDSYMALTELRLENYEDSLKYITNALSMVNTMKDPRDLGAVNFAMYYISKFADENKEKGSIFKEILTDSTLHYKKEAIKYLDKHRDVFELNILNA
ncbi:putative ATPase [Peptoniphilus sp. ING2-D1G]|nr:putative ATPase [Peptoniphilus sp. ING2-D1G]